MKLAPARPALLLAALALTAAPLTALAQDKPLPGPPSASVYIGECLNPTLDPGQGRANESAFGGALAGAVVPKLIDMGLDWIGNQLTRMAEDEKTVLFGNRATEGAFNTRLCLQMARWAPEGGQTLDALVAGRTGDWTTDEDDFRLNRQRPLDFFAEFWIRPSRGGDQISLTPSLLYYPKQLASARNGRKDTAIVVGLTAQPPGGSATTQTWALSRQSPDTSLRVLLYNTDNKPAASEALIRLCESLCVDASPWFANPWAISKGGGAGAAGNGGLAGGVVAPGSGRQPAYEPRPMNLRLEVTEIRSGSKFFKALAEVYNAAKPTLDTQLQQLLLADQREKAEAADETAQAGALNAYATKISDAETTRLQKYCVAKTQPNPNWQALSAELRSKQILANVAAAAASLPPPFDKPVAVTGTHDAALCP